MPHREISPETDRELTLILAYRILNQKILDELWEELRMFKVKITQKRKGWRREKIRKERPLQKICSPWELKMNW